MIRLFVALPIPDDITLRLHSFVDRCKAKSPGLRWSRPEDWHVTLKFLGNTDDSRLDPIVRALEPLRSPACEVTIADVDAFPRAGVLYAGVVATPHLAALAAAAERALAPIGFPAENRAYRPHVTLARGSRSAETAHHLRSALAVQAPSPFGSFHAHTFALFQSHTGPQGSRYEILRRFPL